MDDAQIIDLYFARSQNAVRETEKIYGAYCFSIADNILHNRQDVEECVSDTWLRAWNSIPPQKPSRLKLFLGKITRNLAFDRYRQKNADKRGNGECSAVLDELAECVASSDDVEKSFDAKILRQSLNRFLKSLPQRERQIFLKRYFYAESVKSIAGEFQITANHCTVILKRVRKKLQAYLEQEGFL
ncbi:MAG: sigma-70 family RNA polymerase sigma factor [Oscillospiraceae bacterium]|nr:sigma-70 family RNA polymerase sigma factor [Oscillospiraceae bacterium]